MEHYSSVIVTELEVSLWKVNTLYEVPSSVGTVAVRRTSLLGYLPCGEGMGVVRAFMAFDIMALIFSFSNAMMSVVYMVMTKSEALRFPILCSVFVGCGFNLVAFGTLLGVFYSRLCGLESMHLSDVIPRIGFVGTCVAIGLNIFAAGGAVRMAFSKTEEFVA